MASETEEGDTFFKNYTPTFMDADFFCEPPSLFETIIPDDCHSQTEFFTFFSADMPSFSTKKSNKKARTSTKQKMQKGSTIYEEEEYEIFELGIITPAHDICSYI